MNRLLKLWLEVGLVVSIRARGRFYIKILLLGTIVYFKVQCLLEVPRGELFGRENDERAYERVNNKNIISPPSVVPPTPPGRIVLSIIDLLPHLADGRTITLELCMYAAALERSRGEMALPRVLEDRRRRNRRLAREKAVVAEYQPLTEGRKRRVL